MKRATGPRKPGTVTDQTARIPLQRSSQPRAQSGTSCSATTSGASRLASRTMRSRYVRPVFGCVRP